MTQQTKSSRKWKKFIKDFHVEPEKIKEKSSKNSLEDNEELEEELVTLQEQEALIIEETQETNTVTEHVKIPTVSYLFIPVLIFSMPFPFFPFFTQISIRYQNHLLALEKCI